MTQESTLTYLQGGHVTVIGLLSDSSGQSQDQGRKLEEGTNLSMRQKTSDKKTRAIQRKCEGPVWAAFKQAREPPLGQWVFTYLLTGDWVF